MQDRSAFTRRQKQLEVALLRRGYRIQPGELIDRRRGRVAILPLIVSKLANARSVFRV